MEPIDSDDMLMARRLQLLEQERQNLCRHATRSDQAIRRRPEEHAGYRQPFATDADRILHSRAYSRYIDKTQVFSLTTNDHVSHRIIHVQLVSRIARTIGRFLGLNEDLIEAIALGHDIGHPPFGHDGEKFLSELCTGHGLPAFQHNIQSVRFLDHLERKGRGWNLTLQVLDGILCHDGEVDATLLSPVAIEDFSDLDAKLRRKAEDPATSLAPGTPEGCVVRFADTIGYIGRDIEDAITLGIITRSELPEDCVSLLGNTNGTIVYNLVTDLIRTSSPGFSGSSPTISFSPTIAATLKNLKAFNYHKIYLTPKIKRHLPLIGDCYRKLFHYYLERVTDTTRPLPANIDIMTDITDSNAEEKQYTPAERVRDFIAGMTDSYFLEQARSIGCTVPEPLWVFRPGNTSTT